MRAAATFPVVLFLASALSGCLGEDSGDEGDDFDSESSGQPGQNETLTADFSYAPSAPAAGVPVRFTDQSRDTEFSIVDRAWDFGDGQGSTAKNPSHVFVERGVYAVTLRVKNDAGLEAVARSSLPVHDGGEGPPSNDSGETGPMAFGEAVNIQTGDGGEPSLAIDSEGRIFVNPIGRLYRSIDEGKTFQSIAYPGLFAHDSHVAIDDDDTVWVSDLGGYTTLPVPSVSVYSSTDHGDSFPRGNPLASDTVANDRQWLAPMGGDKAFLLFRHCTVTGVVVCVDGGTAVSRLTKTTDGGQTWLPLTASFEWESFALADPRDGTLYVVQANGKAIDVATSTNDGQSFTQSRVTSRRTPVSNLFVNGAVDDDGNVYVAWTDKDTSQYDVWMAYSRDRGAQWSQPIRVSSSVGTHIFPWITAGGPGRVAVAWYGTSEVAATPDQASDDAEWFVFAAQSTDVFAEEPVFAQARATGVVHEGPICVGGATCLVTLPGDPEQDRDLLDFLSTAVMPDGRLGIAFGNDGSSSTTKTQFVLQSGGPPLRATAPV